MRKFCFLHFVAKSIRLNQWKVSVILVAVMANPPTKSGIRDNRRRGVGADFLKTKHSIGDFAYATQAGRQAGDRPVRPAETSGYQLAGAHPPPTNCKRCGMRHNNL